MNSNMLLIPVCVAAVVGFFTISDPEVHLIILVALLVLIPLIAEICAEDPDIGVEYDEDDD